MKTLFRTLLLAACTMSVSSLHAQIPLLNSYPEASAVIYLDFDGEFVSGTGWNWMGAINAAPATTSPAAIVETVNRVAEDYRPFNINITTDLNVYLAAPADLRIRVILTPTYSWYGHAGGVAFVNSFVWGDDTPCWVFSSLLGDDPKFLAEAVSHEAGHTLGLQHQSEYDLTCRKMQEYYGGQGEGQIGWAPIMGVGYYKNLTTWSIGPNAVSCNRIQNDIQVIAGRVGFREDDHAGSADSATVVPVEGVNFSVSGLINQPDDADVFKVELPISSNLVLNGLPQSVGSGNDGANIDLRIAILNSARDTIGVYNPYDLLDAGIDTSLNQGTYYIVATGVGNINHSNYGSMGYYSLSGALLQVLPLRKFTLRGSRTNGNVELKWTYQATEPVKQIIIESSVDGIHFTSVATVGGASMHFTYAPVSLATYYRLKAVTAVGGQEYFSNVIGLNDANREQPQILSRMIDDALTITCTTPNNYVLFDGTGRVIRKGRLERGQTTLGIKDAPPGLLMLRLDDGKRAVTEKLLKR